MKTTRNAKNATRKAFEASSAAVIRKLFPSEHTGSLLRSGLQSFLLGIHSSPAAGMRAYVRGIDFSSDGRTRLDQLVAEIDTLYKASGLEAGAPAKLDCASCADLRTKLADADAKLPASLIRADMRSGLAHEEARDRLHESYKSRLALFDNLEKAVAKCVGVSRSTTQPGSPMAELIEAYDALVALKPAEKEESAR